MGHTSYIPGTDNPSSVLVRDGHAAGVEQSHVPAVPNIRDTAKGGRYAGVDVNVAPLQTVAAGIRAGAFPQQFMGSINAGNEQLGNRAFVQWVEGLHGRGKYPGTQEPLQLAPKRRKKKGESTAAEIAQGVSEVTTDVPPGAGAQAEAESEVPPSPAEPRETAVPGEKKKKKPKAQVALNTLRTEGVESFRRYVDEEISITDSLRGIRDRIIRAGDLGGIKDAALGVVAARLRALDSEEELTAPEVVGPGQDREEPVLAQIKTDPTAKEKVLLDCCIRGDIGWAKRLLKFGTVDINMGSENGTLLCIAAFKGHANIARELLSLRGIDVNLAHQSGASPLYFAAQQGHAEVVKLLLAARGINVNLAEIRGITPLCIAAQMGREETVRLLLAVPQIKIDACKNDGATPLFCAAQNNFPAIVELLILRGANVNLALDDSTPPLCSVAKHGNVEVARLLLQHSEIQINQTTKNGVTALSIASQKGHKEIVKMLLRKGADPNIANKAGVTALQLGCVRGHTATVEMLLHAGADMKAAVTVGETEKYTPYGLAQLGGHRGIMSILERCRQKKMEQSFQVEKLSLEDQPGRPSSSMTPAQTVPTPGTQPTAQPGEAVSTSTVATVSPPKSPLDLAKEELIQEILRKLEQDNLESLEGIRLMVEVRAAGSIDSLCVLYNRLAGIERQRERARCRKARRGVLAAEASTPGTGPAFALGQQRNLDAEAVESEIRHHLAQSHHRFISQAVNDMEFGRGKPTSGYPGLLHASAGIADVGSCSVFFYADAVARVIRIVGIGHHEGGIAYRLDYASDELRGSGRILRIA